MNRTQLMLGGLLLVQLVLILIFHSPFSDATTTQPRPLIPELAALTPGQLEIQGPDDARLMLVKRGEEWQVDDLGGFPADSQKVEAMIEELEMLDNFNNIVCIEIAEPYDEDTLGGYLGITGGFGGGFIMGLKVHFADFGKVTGLGPDTGDLKGPIYIFSLGGAFGG